VLLCVDGLDGTDGGETHGACGEEQNTERRGENEDGGVAFRALEVADHKYFLEGGEGGPMSCAQNLRTGYCTRMRPSS